VSASATANATDFEWSAVLVFAALAVAAAYARRVSRSGAARHVRIDRAGASFLLGKSVMQMGYWAIRPVATACVALGIGANAVSWSSLVFGAAAGAFLAVGHLGVGAALSVVSSLCDALDGMIAREIGTASDSGEVLDATVDRYVELFFLGGLAFHERTNALAMGFALAATAGTVMVSYATAKAEALHVEAPRVGRNAPCIWCSARPCHPSSPLPELAWACRRGSKRSPFWRRSRWSRSSAMRRRSGGSTRWREPSEHRLGRAPGNRGRPNGSRGMPMAPQATSSAELRRHGRGWAAERSSADGAGTWSTLGRHQVGSIIASMVDFGTMILCVEAFRLTPVAGTAIGATLGAVTNFCLGRIWIFRRQSGQAAPQALRYALVSAASAAWNSLGEHLMHDLAHVQYVIARALVALAVSLLWNFPLQRRFVFHEGRAR
jgi:phosphatidylglycerophosphate synthase/putative flippase GtrA